MAHLHRKNILQKTAQVAGSTLASRLLGVIREILTIRFLGQPGILSDAFLTAFMLPNSLRKIFAEGALSAAFVPVIVKTVKQNKKDHADSLMSLAFIVFEGMLLIVCALVMLWPDPVLRLVAPGFSPEQIAATVPYVRLLMPFIFFISSSALLAGALQSVGHFFVPAFGPVLLNGSFIIGLLICLWWQLPVAAYCIFILIGGLVQLLQHWYAYFKLGFSFGSVSWQTWKEFRVVLGSFFLCFMSMSVMEINFFIDRAFASYLPEGSISLVYYANRFMGIPLGVFAVAFSTILLPHFSRIATYAPKRFSLYLLESAKFVAWITVPVMIVMSFFATDIFRTFSSKFTQAQVTEAAWVLIAFVAGLFFFSLNKIALNVYYALQETIMPVYVSIVATIANAGLNYILVSSLLAPGLALATSISGLIQTVLLLFFLAYRYGFKMYLGSFMAFLGRYALQLALITPCFGILYYALLALIQKVPHHSFFINAIGFWLWVAPLSCAYMVILFMTRRQFGLKMYFID